MKKPMTKRKQQARETRARIVKSALKLFNEHGFENVSMEMIAEEAQASIGAIYHHFSGKEEIAAQTLSILDELYEEFFTELMEAEDYRELTALEKLQELFVFVQARCAEQAWLKYAYIHDLKNSQGEANEAQGNAKSAPGIMVVRVNEERILYQCYATLLKLCRETGQLPETLTDKEVIDVLTQISRGLLVDWMFRNGDFDVESQARRLIMYVMGGMKNSKSRGSTAEKE